MAFFYWMAAIAVAQTASSPPLIPSARSVGTIPETPPSPAASLISTDKGPVPNPDGIKDVQNRVGLLENEREWVIGLSAGLGIGIALVVWLRKDIVRTLVTEAFPNSPPAVSGQPSKWYPNKYQWIVTWAASTIVSILFLCFFPKHFDVSLRVSVVVLVNAALF